MLCIVAFCQSVLLKKNNDDDDDDDDVVVVNASNNPQRICFVHRGQIVFSFVVATKCSSKQLMSYSLQFDVEALNAFTELTSSIDSNDCPSRIVHVTSPVIS